MAAPGSLEYYKEQRAARRRPKTQGEYQLQLERSNAARAMGADRPNRADYRGGMVLNEPTKGYGRISPFNRITMPHGMATGESPDVPTGTSPFAAMPALGLAQGAITPGPGASLAAQIAPSTAVMTELPPMARPSDVLGPNAGVAIAGQRRTKGPARPRRIMSAVQPVAMPPGFPLYQGAPGPGGMFGLPAPVRPTVPAYAGGPPALGRYGMVPPVPYRSSFMGAPPMPFDPMSELYGSLPPAEDMIAGGAGNDMLDLPWWQLRALGLGR